MPHSLTHTEDGRSHCAPPVFFCFVAARGGGAFCLSLQNAHGGRNRRKAHTRMTLYPIKKAALALRDLPRFFFRTRRPRVIMTLLVKNEEELLERNLLFHRAMGVDGFIVTDNNSSDSTPDIIERYRAKGWIVEVVKETATGYEQKRWVDRMAWSAKTRHGADWIINADADEFWYAPQGLKAAFAATRANILRCPIVNLWPDERTGSAEWTRYACPVPNPADYGLSPHSIFGRANHKVAHRAAGYLQISMGNHKVSMFPSRRSDSDITVFHLGVRGKAQFVAKMEQGGRELAAHKGRHGGRHWKYFYNIYKEGRLGEEYENVIGRPQFARLEADGYIGTDTRLRDCLRAHGIR